ncbi:hypothetical protein JD844_001283 [Phrynosoma platyrhinos]|uniref:Peptidase S1 domain-containing protein n=1 Tax=Phrynosoma platyrhinos TaxID=52577 RepID=A0ABQ7T9Y6_PHRPL|nr:hypothetical protein JD844_001283 [Phrynosoma platyrhinos]
MLTLMHVASNCEPYSEEDGVVFIKYHLHQQYPVAVKRLFPGWQVGRMRIVESGHGKKSNYTIFLIISVSYFTSRVGLPISPTDWKVVLGRLKLTGRQTRGLESNVSKIIPHENYTHFEKGDDIALVRLTNPVNYSRDISPVCLPYSDHRFSFGTQCWLSGWGDIASNVSLPNPMALQEMAMDLLTIDTCNCIYSNLRNRRIVNPALPGMVCAMTPDRMRGPCKGDSGGPLVCLENGHWFQAGIMSFSMGCGQFYGPTLLTETKSYASWIQQHVEGATFADQMMSRPNTTDKYMCIDEHGQLSSLGGVEVKLLGPKTCNCVYNKTSEHGQEIPITPEMLCATPYRWNMRCEEGIGDPLVCNHNGVWFLAGISSFGKGCGTVVRPGVYTAVSAYEEWIMQLAWSAYYDVQKPPLPTASDEDTCLHI